MRRKSWTFSSILITLITIMVLLSGGTGCVRALSPLGPSPNYVQSEEKEPIGIVPDGEKFCNPDYVPAPGEYLEPTECQPVENICSNGNALSFYPQYESRCGKLL